MNYYSLISSMLKTTISTLPTGLYAVYKAESNANDSKGTYNGTAQGGLTYVSGVSGNQFQFNSGNSEILLPDNFRFLDSGINEFSIKFDIYPTNVSTAQGVITNFFQTSVYYGYMIWLYNNVITLSRYNGTTNAYALSSTTLTANTQYNIVFTRKNGSTKCYINGILVSSDTDTNSIVYDTTHYTKIGSRRSFPVVTDWFINTGTKIDEVYFYTKELTQSEVTELQTKYYPF